MKHSKALIGLSLFLVVATVSTWLVFNTLRREVAGPTNTFTAMFTDVSGLKVGDDVRVAGVRVGRVDRVDLDGTLAKVTFRVAKNQVLYEDTTAAVTYQNIIGQRYLGLAMGSSDQPRVLPDHGRLPVERTRPSFDVSNLLNGFEPLFTLLNPEQVDNFTTGIIQALQGNSGSILTLVSQTSTLTETLAGPDQVLGDLINNLNDVTAVLSGQNDNLRAVIVNSRDTLATLADRQDELVTSTGSLNRAVGRLAEITKNIDPALQALISREPGFVGHLTGDAKERISFFGANLALVLKGLARASQQGSYIDGYICDINASVFAFIYRLIPAVVRLASPGNTIQHSPICSK